jgi:hypothetical protein
MMKMSLRFNRLCFLCLFGSLLQHTGWATAADASDQVLAEQIGATTVFSEALKPIEGKVPPVHESRELWEVVSGMRDRTISSPVERLESFLQSFPDSGWAPSIRVNLGRYYERRGRYGRALEHWSKAWEATKLSIRPDDRRIADFAFTYSTRVLLGFGRVMELEVLLKQAQGRSFSTPVLQATVNGTQIQYLKMVSGTDEGFRCGTFAVASVGQVLGAAPRDIKAVIALRSPVTGFSMERLVGIAQNAGIDLVPVTSRGSNNIVVPSVVHWKGDHFAAIVEERKGFYKVVDPGLGRPKWMTWNDIEAESSGRYLIPRKQMGTMYEVMSEQQTRTTFGRGYVHAVNDDNDGCSNGSGGNSSSAGQGSSGESSGVGKSGPTLPCSGGECGGGGGGGGPGSSAPTCKTCPNGSSPPGLNGGFGPGSFPGGKFAAAGDPGMPVWKVSEPYINLWLYDEPLSYSPSFGQRISFQLVYKQRETKTTSVGIFNFGEMWHSSWLNFAVDTAPGASASMMNAGGGERQYYPDGSPCAKTNCYPRG